MPSTEASTGAVTAVIGSGTNTIGKVYITDGTDSALVSATGELSVLDTNSAAIKTAVQLIDDVVATDGAADVAKLLQVGGTDGTNAQIVSVGADGKVNVADGGASLTVDGTFWQVTQPVSGTFWQVTQPVSGTFWQVTQPVSATDLDIRNLAPATDSVKVSDGTTELPVFIEGSAAKASGLQVAGRYDATIPTAVDDGDATLLLTDAYGALQTTGHVAAAVQGTDNQSTAQTNKEIIAAPGAGLSLYITDIIVSNGATAGNIKFVESTASSPVDKVEVLYFAINGGAPLCFKTPLKLSANVNFGYTSVTVTTHSVLVLGYAAP